MAEKTSRGWIFDERLTQTLFGEHDEHLRTIEEAFDVKISSRGNEIFVHGGEDTFGQVQKLLRELQQLINQGYPIRSSDVVTGARQVRERQTVVVRDWLGLLGSALQSPGDEELLAEVRANADAIIDAIDEVDGEVPELSEIDPEWIVRVLHAVDGEVIPDPAAAQGRREWVEHEEAIGRWFSQFASTLPEPLRLFHAFRTMPRVSHEREKSLSTQPSSRAAGWLGNYLAAYGLTPIDFAYATQAISRVLDQEWANPRPVAAREQVSRILGAIGEICDCDASTAQFLLQWLMHASEHRANIVPCMTVEHGPGKIIFMLREPRAGCSVAPIVINKNEIDPEASA